LRRKNGNGKILLGKGQKKSFRNAEKVITDVGLTFSTGVRVAQDRRKSKKETRRLSELLLLGQWN
jgi:hypothetical protein